MQLYARCIPVVAVCLLGMAGISYLAAVSWYFLLVSWFGELCLAEARFWKTGGSLRGNFHQTLILHYPNIPIPPTGIMSCANVRKKATFVASTVSYAKVGGKMTCRGERPTSREDQLACCEPSRACVLRHEPPGLLWTPLLTSTHIHIYSTPVCALLSWLA